MDGATSGSIITRRMPGGSRYTDGAVASHIARVSDPVAVIVLTIQSSNDDAWATYAENAEDGPSTWSISTALKKWTPHIAYPVATPSA
ncbi:hypothetical protein D9M70_518270 [compost metagenome]